MRTEKLRPRSRTYISALILLCVVGGPAVAAGRLDFKPGWNMFSRDQDVQLGKENVAAVEKELPLVKNAEVERYVSNLGRKLVGFAPGNTDYPWTFKVVDSKDINAFALPGGFIYVNRAVLEVADNEAQVAGVMAHEIGHVVMRHGTHQASQRVLAQFPLAILGGFLGQSGSLMGQLAQAGIGFGVGSLLTKYSRDAESQADDFGTYTLYQAGYDPYAMAQFFEIIGKKYPQPGLQFFSDHPNPGNRIKNVDALIPDLGPKKKGMTDSPEFQATKRVALALPPPPKAKPASGQPTPKAAAPPPAPSSKFVKYRGTSFTIAHPDNWQAQGEKDSVTIAPPGGILTYEQGGSAQAYGAMVFHHTPSKSGWGLVDGTQELIESIRQSNPNLRVLSQSSTKVRGKAALSTRLENDSPLEGQKETDFLITVRGSKDLTVLLFVAPQGAFGSYEPTFNTMLRSVELR
ncbi:MAG: M48 family metalloprotease [Terriglobia bacterium]